MKEEDTRASGKLHLFCRLGIFTVTHTDWGDRKRGGKRGFTAPCSGLQPLLGTEGHWSVPAPSITFPGSSNTASLTEREKRKKETEFHLF